MIVLQNKEDMWYTYNMDYHRLPTTLPPSLYQFFWDVDARRLDPSKNADYVINRLLDKGGLDGARWTLQKFPKERLIKTLKKMRDFSPRNGRFWTRYLNIPEEEVACLNPSYLAMRRQHWPF